jgi:hypothetical protein
MTCTSAYNLVITMIKQLLNVVIMKTAETYCYVWKYLRCRLIRRIDDLDYFISSCPKSNQNLPFIYKKVVVNDYYEKATALKIGDVVVEYSLAKLVRRGQQQDDISISNFELEHSISNTVRTHHNATVVDLKNYRKGKENVSDRKNIS